MTAFYDLHVPVSGSDLDPNTGEPLSGEAGREIGQRLARVAGLGYSGAALAITVSQAQMVASAATAKKKKSNKAKRARTEATSIDEPETPSIPSPPDLKSVLRSLHSEYSGLSKLQVLTRLNVVIDNNNVLPIVQNSPNVAKYDLIAVRPTSTQALQALLKTGWTFDVLWLPPEAAKDIRWSRKLYREVTERHVSLEICYAPCIADSSQRRNVFSLGHQFHSVGKSRQVLLSSCAEDIWHIRAPRDVISLGFLFGLNETQSKESVSKAPMHVVRAAAGRKLGPYRVTVEKIEVDEGEGEEEEAEEEEVESESDCFGRGS